MRLRRWESVAEYRLGGKKMGETTFRRHFSQRAAQRWAESITNDPLVLASTLESVVHPNSGGHMLFADPLARRVPDAPGRLRTLRISGRRGS